MKKLVICLMLSAMAFCFASCASTTGNEAGSKTEGEKTEKVELTDPRGKTLESTATGETAPKIVKTTYETEDVVVADIIPTEMGYAVDPTGETDSTQGIQQALYDCYDAGGGMVYLPAGNYAITEKIYIPPFVTLRGDWQDPDEGTEYGTIISVWAESDDSTTSGIFEMGGSTGAVGLTIYYPLQTLEDNLIFPYPYTFYVDGYGINAMSVNVKNVTIINGYRGVGTSYAKPHECLQLENVKGTFLESGFALHNSSDVGTAWNLVVSNKYWKEAAASCMKKVDSKKLDSYTHANTTGMILGDIEWTEFNDINVDGCAIGIHIVAGVRAYFDSALYNTKITDCEQGMVVDSLYPVWEGVMAESYVEGGIQVNTTEGYLKLFNVEVKGGITEKREGSVIKEEANPGDYKVDTETSYVKPAENLVVAELSNGVLDDDVSTVLQKYLDDVSAQGGGIVYIPGGTYIFRKPVTVPAGVQIRGTSSVAARDMIGCSNGTVFLCYYGDDAKNTMTDQAFITLAGENAGLNGIRIIYPEKGPTSDNLATTYAVKGQASGVYVINSEIVAAAYGIDFTGCDNHYIDSVYTCCYNNSFRLGGKDGIMSRCLQNGTVMQRMSVPEITNWVSNGAEMFEHLFPKLHESCQLIIVENATNQQIYSVFAYGIATFVVNNNSENTYMNNVATDGMISKNPQIIMNGGSMTGVTILRSMGYSYEHVAGKLSLYNRLSVKEVGERTVEREK